jgi:protein translocase SecG subunit
MSFSSLVIGLLTIALVLNCLLLILLVLIQLPKKEAGLGMAFGGSAADALFGAGSGTVISRWTKYGTTTFLVLSLVLSVMRNHEARAVGRNIASELERQARTGAAATAPLAVTNPVTLPTLPSLPATNAPATNPPAAPAGPAGATPPAPAPNPGQ